MSKENMVDTLRLVENFTETEKNHSDKLADKGLWNPKLVAEITHITGGKITLRQSFENNGSGDDFNSLEWSTAGNADVIIVPGKNNDADNIHWMMIINTNRYRLQRDELALRGIAAEYDLEYIEDDADLNVFGMRSGDE